MLRNCAVYIIRQSAVLYYFRPFFFKSQWFWINKTAVPGKGSAVWLLGILCFCGGLLDELQDGLDHLLVLITIVWTTNRGARANRRIALLYGKLHSIFFEKTVELVDSIIDQTTSVCYTEIVIRAPL